MNPPVHLTKTRVQALIDTSNRGAYDLATMWVDNYDVDITEKSDKEIRRQIRESEFGPDPHEVWEAVDTYRRARDARLILRGKYLA